MKNNMFGKGLVLGIIILFIGASIIPSIAGYDKDVEKIDYMLNENETLNMKNDDYNNLIKQVVESEVTLKNDWWKQDKLLASDGAAGDEFGKSVSISGDYAIVGAHYDGSAYIFICSGTSWTQQDKLLASEGAGDMFGRSVSISGDYAIIGAYEDDDNAGSAYVFKRSGTSWTQQDKLLASDGVAGDQFGYYVSIDGDYAIIGSPWDDDNGGSSGSAYIFTRSGTDWMQQAKLLASDGAAGDYFGESVSISGDYAIIGEYGDDDNGVDSGSAYIFTRSGTSWTQQAKLLASDGAANDRFGRSVSIDGDHAIIGSSWDDDYGDNSGSAYIFARSGTSWTQQAKLLPSVGANYDYFGGSVSISGDYAITGVHWDDDHGSNSGSAYVFTKANIPVSTLYVGGSGPNNYTSIQEAIDNANDGDTVFVYDDSSPYYEHLIIDKNITLIGEDKNSTVINGTNNIVVRIVATNGVSIRGFTIEGGSKGIKIEHSSNITIWGNIIRNN